MNSTPATCACGVQRAADDPSVVGLVHISGVSQRYVKPNFPGSLGTHVPPRVRACRNCGVIYVAELAGLAEPEPT